MLKIWVDSTVLAKNRARGRNDPPIIVWDTATGRRRMAHELSLGEGLRMVYEKGCSTCGVVHLVVSDGPALDRTEILR